MTQEYARRIPHLTLCDIRRHRHCGATHLRCKSEALGWQERVRHRISNHHDPHANLPRLKVTIVLNLRHRMLADSERLVDAVVATSARTPRLLSKVFCAICT